MTEIQLKIDVETLRKLYFKHNYQRYFFGPNTKRQSIYLVIALLAYPPFATYCLNNGKDLYFILGGLFFALICYDFSRKARPIIAWKKAVLAFLDKTSKLQSLRIRFDEKEFQHFQDDEVLTMTWNSIQSSDIFSDYLWIFGETSILLPKSSMTEEEFEGLKKMIKKTVKSVNENL